MTDDELKQATHDAACHLSYYNAAEGNSWRDETHARAKASGAFHDLKAECEERGLDWRQTDMDGKVIGYLVPA